VGVEFGRCLELRWHNGEGKRERPGQAARGTYNRLVHVVEGGPIGAAAVALSGDSRRRM
jgi:hypothetical protein